MNAQKYIYKTDYFGRYYTWNKRYVSITIISIAVIVLSWGELDIFVILALTSGIVLIGVAWPIDDIAITEKSFVHFRKSWFPVFSKTYEYKIAEIKSFRCKGFHNDTWKFLDTINGGVNMGGMSNSIEIVFNDGKSISFDLKVSRDKLDKAIMILDELKGRSKI